jgi:hypothetical protein
MFDRIEVDIMHVPFKILVITNPMFPKTTLPDCRFAMFVFRLIHPFLIVQPRFDLLGKVGFDQTPSFGKIGVIDRQLPDAMHVIGQQYPGLDVKGMLLLCCCNGVSQGMPVLRQGKEFAAPVSYHGKEVGRTFGIDAAIIRHFFSSAFLDRPAVLPATVSFKAIRTTAHGEPSGILSGGRCPPYRLPRCCKRRCDGTMACAR